MLTTDETSRDISSACTILLEFAEKRGMKAGEIHGCHRAEIAAYKADCRQSFRGEIWGR